MTRTPCEPPVRLQRRLGAPFARSLVAAILMGCTADRIVTPIAAPPALAIYPGGGDGQTGTVGTTLPLPLVVQLTGLSGQTNGHVLNFVVTSGGGTVFAPSVLTGTPTQGIAKNQSGIAHNTWTLGPKVGTQTVEARLVDPRTGATLTQAVFQATAVAGAAAKIVLSAGQAQAATAGTTVAIAPSVLVTDALDNPLSGVPVTFAVTGGGGAIVGPAQVSTNTAGIASLGGWRLGNTAGSNSLTATAGSLSPVSFSATGRAGLAAQIQATAGGSGLRVEAGTNVPVTPTIVVRDLNGNPVAGAAVTFTVTEGGGSIDGISTLTLLTDQNGLAGVPWTLGPVSGSNTLRATALSLSGSPVIFTATAFQPVYIANQGNSTITVYDPEATGDVAPLRIIGGANTGLVVPAAMLRDPSGQLWVTNINGNSITVYAHGAAGNASPVRTISGPATTLNRPFGLARDASGQIYVFNYGSGTITVFAANATGNTAPVRTIGGGNTGLIGAPGLLIAGGELYVADADGNSIKVFPQNASGNIAPTRIISGPSTNLSGPVNLQMDAAGNLYTNNWSGASINVYAPGASGDAAPIRVISGAATLLNFAAGFALGPQGQLFVCNYVQQYSIMSYAAGANGNVAPLRRIAGGNTALNQPGWLVF